LTDAVEREQQLLRAGM